MTSLRAHAAACEADGQAAAAIPLYQKILSDSEQLPGYDTQAAQRNLAAAYVLAGQPHKAIPLYQRIAEQAEQNNGTGHPSSVEALNNLAYASAMATRACGPKRQPRRKERRLTPTAASLQLLAKLVSTAALAAHKIGTTHRETPPEPTCDSRHPRRDEPQDELHTSSR